MPPSLCSIVWSWAFADISESHRHYYLVRAWKEKISPGDFGPEDMASDMRTHIRDLEVSACLCAEMSSHGHPYHFLMIIKKVGCFSPTWRADNKESAGLSEIPCRRPASRPLDPPLPPPHPSFPFFPFVVWETHQIVLQKKKQIDDRWYCVCLQVRNVRWY